MSRADEVDVKLVEALFVQGPAALLEAGMTRDEAVAFYRSPPVALAMMELDREYTHHTTLHAHAKFAAERGLHRLLPDAVEVYAQAVQGPVYARDAEGHVLNDDNGYAVFATPEPTPVQVRAARTILDGCGVADPKVIAASAGEANMKLLFAGTEEETVVVESDPSLVTEEQRALSRERVRNVILSLIPELEGARKEASQKIGLGKETPTRLKRKTPPRRKKGKVVVRKSGRRKKAGRRASS